MRFATIFKDEVIKMKKIFTKFVFIAIALVCFSAPSFAAKGGITSIVNQSATSAFSVLKNHAIEELTNYLIDKEIEDNEAKAEMNIKLDETKADVAKREASEASGKAAAEAKSSAEASAAPSPAPAAEAQKPEQPLQARRAPAVQEEKPAETATENSSNESSASQNAADVPANSPVIPEGSLGIDVSQFNGDIDWKAVSNSGVKFAFIRVAGRYSVSGTIYDDTKFEQNIKNAKANGVKVGVYFFTQAVNTNEAIEEARYAISKIKPYGVDLPIVIDSESVEGKGRHAAIGVSDRTKVVKAFCDEVSNSGYTPMIYASTSWLNSMLNMSELSAYKVWVAQYNHTLEYGGSYNIWQYTSEGSINGISGNVDCNRWYR